MKNFDYSLIKKSESVKLKPKIVVNFKHLLSIDGFNPRISRKASNTKKSSTLKYDVIIACSSEKKVKFIKKTIFCNINHKKKKLRFNDLEGEISKQKKLNQRKMLYSQRST